MSIYHKINIIGCGNLGSWLAFHIVLISELYDDIKELCLYDNDCLYESNFPYLTISLDTAIRHEYLNSPKVYVLSSILEDIKGNTNLSITPHKTLHSEDTKLEGYSIDCRDENKNQNMFNLKLAYDGEYGRIIVNPPKEEYGKKSRYVYNTYRYKTMKFASDVVELLVKNKLNECGDFCINYKD